MTKLFILIANIFLVSCVKNNITLRKHPKRINQIRSNDTNRMLTTSTFDTENNLIKVTADPVITTYIKLVKIRFDNENYGIIHQRTVGSLSEIIYNIFDKNGHQLIKEYKLLDLNSEFDWNSKENSKKMYLIDGNKVNGNEFFLRILTHQCKEDSTDCDNSIDYNFYSVKFYSNGTNIDYQFISNLCKEIDIKATKVINNGNFISVMDCERSDTGSKNIHQLRFDSNGVVLGKFLDDLVVDYYMSDFEHDIEPLSNGRYAISSFDFEDGLNGIKVFNEDGTLIKQVDTSYRPSGVKKLDYFYLSSYNNGFIAIFIDDRYMENYEDSKRIYFANFNNDGEAIGQTEVLTNAHSCYYSKIIKKDKKFYLSCDKLTRPTGSLLSDPFYSISYPVTLNSQEYEIILINSDEKDVYDEYNDMNGVTFNSWQNAWVYLARYDSSNIESISKIVSPTPETEPNYESLINSVITQSASSKPTSVPTPCPTRRPTSSPTNSKTETNINIKTMSPTGKPSPCSTNNTNTIPDIILDDDIDKEKSDDITEEESKDDEETFDITYILIGIIGFAIISVMVYLNIPLLFKWINGENLPDKLPIAKVVTDGKPEKEASAPIDNKI